MKRFQLLAVTTVICLSLSLVGCSKKQTVAPEDGSDGSGSVTDSVVDSGSASSDSGTAMGLQTVYFPFDSSEIAGEGKTALENNIQILKDNPSLNVQIEGHCDERGGIQYNLALGERRAAAIKQALTVAGIRGNRISTISFGKERPLVQGSNEEAWGRNRRGNFVITSK